MRIEVTSSRGLREGVPNLMRLFNEYQVPASFFFPLGKDLAGHDPMRTWAHRRQTGMRALAYGLFMPAPAFDDESRRIAELARSNGHEIGVIGYSPLAWARHLAHADSDWVAAQLELLKLACGQPPFDASPALAVMDWQTHPDLIGACEASRFRYTSMSRGRMPYLPVLQGQRATVPEIPTTLPTLPEMLRHAGVHAGNVHEYLYAESRHLQPAGHVYSLSADLEGIGALDVMEKLLIMWKGQDGSIRRLGDVLRDIDESTLPRHRMGWGQVAGNRRHVVMQSLEVPA
ncbi:MAG: deacylase [Gammaproteobacteria bacterium]|nr:deacylase [Gammaproteobacteria bacterium]